MRRIALVLAAALLFAACGTGATTDSTSAPVDAAAQATTLPPETTTTTEAPKELTLADFLPGWGTSAEDFDPEAEQERFQAEQVQMQEAIADCMADEGFEYIPFVPDEGDFFFAPFEDEDDFVETLGFGISTWILNDPYLNGDISEEEPKIGALFGREFEDPFANDPNNEIVEGLTEAEREEYYYVLHGEEPDFDFENATEEEMDEFFSNWQPTGCWAEAEQDVFSGQAFFAEFGDAFDDMFERAEADPRIIAIEVEWSACMADAGYTFSAMNEMYEYFSQRMDEIVTWPEPDFGEDFEEPDFDNMTEEELDAYFAEQEAFWQPQYDEAELKALNDEEIATAIANRDCSVDSEDVWQAVMAELEQQFLDENRDALEAFLDET